ncbi:unnamed protein product [Bursaphelenchus xylophilus]|uniref:(pine wood nematode) hypothetical protein n=1 Tax=Bursaphelenchus xylophilus TaxID=6326 RepID=A0A1I7S8M6_BURXY|nr:unnamed protein product [Bursaphelenchus xylophilus]CAG9089484.1 unnamed protein product [Bursaphelenchus xylophilus]
MFNEVFVARRPYLGVPFLSRAPKNACPPGSLARFSSGSPTAMPGGSRCNVAHFVLFVVAAAAAARALVPGRFGEKSPRPEQVGGAEARGEAGKGVKMATKKRVITPFLPVQSTAMHRDCEIGAPPLTLMASRALRRALLEFFIARLEIGGKKKRRSREAVLIACRHQSQR